MLQDEANRPYYSKGLPSGVGEGELNQSQFEPIKSNNPHFK